MMRHQGTGLARDAGLRRRRFAAIAVAMAVLSIGAACRSSRAKLPPAPHFVDVTMTEYRFDYSNEIPSGRVVFKLQNSGREDHGITLLPLPEDFPPIDEQLRGDVRRALTPKANIDVPFGENGIFAVDLSAGRYAILCQVLAPDGVSHSFKGMTSEFRIE